MCVMSIKSWLVSAFVRNYPQTPVGRDGMLKLESALNEKSAFQLVLRNEENSGPVEVKICANGGKKFDVRIRRVGYVPMLHFNTPVEGPEDCEGLNHLPGLVPDPLFDEDSIKLPARETHSFWITLRPKSTIKTGKHKITITRQAEGQAARKHTVEITVHNVRLAPRKNFHITHWFYTDAIIDWYKTDGYDKSFWKLLPVYLKNLADHCQDTVLVPLFTPPVDGVKTPCQLLKVKKTGQDKYNFDFSDVRKYIQIAKQSGIRYFEWSHLVTQWGAEHAIRVYKGQGKTRKLLWPVKTSATAATYKTFLSQLLPRLYSFLKKEKLLTTSLFHLSDEPHGPEHLANYHAFRNYLKQAAPWMRVMDAMSDVEFAKTGMTDIPVANQGVLMDFIKTGVPSWVYYCCNPRGKFLNHLMDTPLSKIAMHGFLCYRFDIGGFLHWGYNFWYRRHTTDLIDPFTISDAGDWPEWAFGDTFLVYPGPEGPIDSIRWEVIGLGFQDYQLLQTIGINRNDKLLEDIRDFADFPKTEKQRTSLRSKLLNAM